MTNKEEELVGTHGVIGKKDVEVRRLVEQLVVNEELLRKCRIKLKNGPPLWVE
jgi:hypothetical protein